MSNNIYIFKKNKMKTLLVKENGKKKYNSRTNKEKIK
jgi:hypothetical protein